MRSDEPETVNDTNGRTAAAAASPSPPRHSSASPPDALQQLSLAGPSRGHKDGKQERTVPCAQCRKIRRVCRWLQDRECERCRKLGLTCSGPQSAIWMDTQLSYSLTLHLVETCRNVASSMPFMGVSLEEFGDRVGHSGGRTDELKPEQELMAAIYMFFGTQFTNHSGIFGTQVDVPSLDSLSLSSDLTPHTSLSVALHRRIPLESVSKLVVERVEALDLSEGTPSEIAERILLSWVALSPLQGDVDEDRHRLLGELAFKAMRILEELDGEEEAAAMLDFALRGLITDEVRQSTVRGVPSCFKPEDASRIFGFSAGPPKLCSYPDSVFTEFLLDPNPVPISSPRPDLENAYDSCETFLHYLNHQLAFAPQSRIVAAVEYCLRGLDALVDYLSHEVTRVLDHPDYAKLPREHQIPRPDGVVSNFVLYRLSAFETLFATQVALNAAGAPYDLIEDGRRRVFEELNDLTDLVSLMLSMLEERPIQAYFVSHRLTMAVDLYRDAYLPEWAATSPNKRDKLLDVFRFAGFAIPQAACLVTILEQAPSPSSPPWSPLLSDSSSRSSPHSAHSTPPAAVFEA
ncbi:hypothetical protein JCM8547_006062 [Rhodosporidiobolus lusitaniae]